MPTYAYRCSACSHEFDEVQRFSDDALTVCPQCGGSIRRVFQPVGVVFKGSGWYITDSRKPESSNGSEPKSDTKPDTKTSPTEPAAKSGDAKPAKAPAAAASTTNPAKSAAD